MKTDAAETVIGPVVIVLLQKLANKAFEPSELFHRVRDIKGAQIVWQLESWPYSKTVSFQSDVCTYTLKLPRRTLCDRSWIAAAPVQLQFEPLSAYCESELCLLLETLLRHTKYH